MTADTPARRYATRMQLWLGYRRATIDAFMDELFNGDTPDSDHQVSGLKSFQVQVRVGPPIPTFIPDEPDLLVPYFPVASALGRALDHDSEEFWRVIAELDRALPGFDWHNAMTDSAATRRDQHAVAMWWYPAFRNLLEDLLEVIDQELGSDPPWEAVRRAKDVLG